MARAADLVEQAERLDRLVADFDLVTTLGLAGVKGVDWDYFEQELAKYGIAAMGGCGKQRGHCGKPDIAAKPYRRQLPASTHIFSRSPFAAMCRITN